MVAGHGLFTGRTRGCSVARLGCLRRIARRGLGCSCRGMTLARQNGVEETLLPGERA
jgi:hypothetical protein